MSLLQALRNDALTARKARDTVAASLLVTLLSEAEKTGLDDGKRESSDAEVIATIRKFLKNNAEFLRVRADDATLKREVVAVSFGPNGVVSNVERFGQERGRFVVLSRRVTEGSVTEISLIGQLLGNLGNFQAADIID